MRADIVTSGWPSDPPASSVATRTFGFWLRARRVRNRLNRDASSSQRVHFPSYRQPKLYFRVGRRLGVMSGDRWNSAKSTAPFAEARFQLNHRIIVASRLFMPTISNDQTGIEPGCAYSSERVLRQGFSG